MRTSNSGRSPRALRAALGALLASGCAEDSGEGDPLCTVCVSPVQTADAASIPEGEAPPASSARDSGSMPLGRADAAVTVASDAGRGGRDGGSASDAGSVLDAASARDAGPARDGAVIGALPDGGPPNSAEAGATGVDASDAGAECNGPKARAGEPCASDTDCDAGLLCDAPSSTCRPISGIKLLHDFSPAGRSDAYSEGLDFAHGSLWQSTAEALFRIDVTARAVVASYPTPSEYGEGLTWKGDVLFHASYRNSNLYAGELKGDQLSFKVLGQLQMTGGCVYGIVEHCDQLFTTRCGRSVVDVYASGTTAPILRTFTVRDTRGVALPEVEDLEIYRGQLWTSTFNSRGYASTLFRVDMTTNQAVAAYEIPCNTLAIDGIAADPSTRTLYVTGKDCPIFVYQVQ